MITFADLEKKREEVHAITLKYKDYNSNDLKYLMLALYTYLPPLNQGIFINTILLKDENEIIEGHNYINLNTGDFTYSDKIIPLNEDLFNNIKRINEKSNSIWLLPNVSEPTKPISNANFTKIFNKFFNEKISTNYLKKLYNGTLNDSESVEEDTSSESAKEIILKESNVSKKNKKEDFVYFEKVRISSRLLNGAIIKMEKDCIIIS